MEQIVALMCGSFNPVTRMHLQMMKIFKQFGDGKIGNIVQGIISPVNDLYHVKRRNLISSHHRINMIKLALEEDSLDQWVECNPWESQQKEWKTTIQVLNYHQDRCKDQFGPSTRLWLISGGDLIESMGIPGLWADVDLEKIVTTYKLFIIPRIGSQPEKFSNSHPILSRHLENIIIIKDWIPNEDSSTQARAAIKEGNYPNNLLHQSVIDYIKTNNLYKD